MFFGPRVPTISPKEASEKLEAGQMVLIDVREQNEIDAAHVKGSTFIRMREIPASLDQIPKDTEVGFLCRSGSRSGQVTAYLIQQGFSNVKNVIGGINRWKNEVDPTLQPI